MGVFEKIILLAFIESTLRMISRKKVFILPHPLKGGSRVLVSWAYQTVFWIKTILTPILGRGIMF